MRGRDDCAKRGLAAGSALAARYQELWDGALVAVGDLRDGFGGSYRLEPIDRPERTRAVHLVLPGTKRVVDVAMDGGRQSNDPTASPPSCPLAAARRASASFGGQRGDRLPSVGTHDNEDTWIDLAE
jgi:hypothetical protein